MHRRAQAGLEYLSTYGFAFMTIIVAVGALTYFGVFDTTSLQNEDCNFPPGVICEDFTLGGAGDDDLALELRNTFGVDINVTSVSATSEGATFINCDMDPLTTWEHEEVELFTCTPDSELPDDKYDVTVTINFTQEGGGYEHYTVGNVFVTAQ